MKYFLGFIIGSAVVSAITRPARIKAFTKAYESTASAKADK